HAIAWLYDQVLRLAIELCVRGLKTLDLLSRFGHWNTVWPRRDLRHVRSFHRRPVIDKRPDWNTARELHEIADVIDVVMSRDQVVDARDPGICDGRHDAIEVSGARESRIGRRCMTGLR